MFENIFLDMLGLITALVVSWACSIESENGATAKTQNSNE